MPSIHHLRSWNLPRLRETPEDVYLNRRRFLGVLGIGAIGLMFPDCARGESGDLYPAKRNEKYKLDRKVTDEAVAGKYNNFYEFGPDKTSPAQRSGNFKTSPWTIEIAGLVKQPRVLDLDDLLKRMPIEERLYRHRCVEAWAMAVPWTGFALKALIDYVQPTSRAKYVRFVSASKSDEMPGIKEQSWYPWPYFEGLRMDEAVNELTLCTVGIYGHRLPNQHGAPLRITVPWKYGYKSPKSIVKIEFVEKEPATFWDTRQPDEYPFESNVDPTKPHPRWSQAKERLIDTGEIVDTQPYNGYGEFVAHLYV